MLPYICYNGESVSGGTQEGGGVKKVDKRIKSRKERIKY